MSVFAVDISLTYSCNFRCSYCFESGSYSNNKMSIDTCNHVISKLDSILNSQWFQENYTTLQIGFWGGEPTLNMDVLYQFYNYYKNHNNVKFFLYTNGYDLTDVFPILLDTRTHYVNDNTPKFFTQISYDGNPVHDLNRKHVTGNNTSDDVKNSIEFLHKNTMPYSLKSTITPNNFSSLYSAYSDMRELDKSLNSRYIGHNWKNSSYFPTIDYTFSDLENFNQYYNELKNNLIQISREEYHYYKQYNKFFFSWFNKNLAICSAGLHMICIDINGDIYKCHGCLYSPDKKDHFVCTISDDHFLDLILKSRQQHKMHFNNISDNCRNCYVEYCLKCNSSKYDYSKKNSYFDKWSDYDIQPQLCSFYKLNTLIKKGLIKLLEDS